MYRSGSTVDCPPQVSSRFSNRCLTSEVGPSFLKCHVFVWDFFNKTTLSTHGVLYSDSSSWLCVLQQSFLFQSTFFGTWPLSKTSVVYPFMKPSDPTKCLLLSVKMSTDGLTIDTTCVSQFWQFDEITISQKNKFVSLCMGKISSHGNHMTEDRGNWILRHDSILDLTLSNTQKFTFHKFLKLPYFF